MGVVGLLKTLKGIGEPRTLDDLEGLCLGVDGYGWLHRAVLTCAEDLVQNRPTTRYLEYIDRRVAQFERAGVKLYFVFDGASLPMKKRVDAQRAALRADAKAQHSLSGSTSHAHRAVDVTTEMASCVCAYLRAKKIPYVVAPYEADPQLVYLELHGHVDGLLSEDSDLLIFGAQRLFTKLDSSGSCIEVNINRLKQSALGSLAGPDQNSLLRLLSVISGCDYSPGITGYGPVKAGALVARHRNLDGVLAAVLRDGKSIPDGFRETARRADLAFRYQRVFDPTTRSLVTLNPVEIDIEDDIIGPDMEPTDALRIARGVWCPQEQRILAVPVHVQRFLSRVSRQPLAPLQPKQTIEKKVQSVLGFRGTAVSPFFSPKPTLACPPKQTETPLKQVIPFETLTPKENVPPSEPAKVGVTLKENVTIFKSIPQVTPVMTFETEPLTPQREIPTPRKIDFKRFAYNPQ